MLPGNPEAVIFGHSPQNLRLGLRRGGCRADGVPVPGAQRIADGAVAGIMADAIGFISAIWWMPFYPIWSLTYIAIGFLVINALAAYGGNAEAV